MESFSKPSKAQQLADILVREIVTGQLPDGARLPPERILAERFSVAVGTLRKALAHLEQEGLLRRVQGSGNYIQAHPIVDSVYAFFRLRLLSGDGVPTAQIINVERAAKPKDAEFFGDADFGYRMRRLRFIAEKPIALEEIWVDGRFEEGFDKSVLIDSMYLFYKEALGLIITRVEDRLSMAHVPDWAPPSFPLATNAPCVYVSRVGWDQKNQAAEYSRTWFDPGLAYYSSVIG